MKFLLRVELTPDEVQAFRTYYGREGRGAIRARIRSTLEGALEAFVEDVVHEAQEDAPQEDT